MQLLNTTPALYPLWIGNFLALAFLVIFVLRQTLRGVPRDLEDAARIDGCGFWRVYWHVMLPLARPALGVITIITLLATWNEWIEPLLAMSTGAGGPVRAHLPIPATELSLILAGCLLLTPPVIATLFFARRYASKSGSPEPR